MTARITGFVTRAEAGLRKPRSISKKITPADGGVALHYGGPAQRLHDHADCVTRWRQWQDYHMDTRGWADIAYTMGVCNHGYVFAGRGAGVRTAANGTNTGNQYYYAVTWIGGDGEIPTQAALDAFEWCIVSLRKNGAGKKVKPHQFFKGTACPGSHLVSHASKHDGKDIGSTPPPAPPAPSGGKMYVVYSDAGFDWGTDLVTRRPFERQDAKATWVNLIQRLGGTVTRQELTREEIESLEPIGGAAMPAEEVSQ